MTVHVTADGDVLDAVALERMGSEAQVVRLLEANRHIAGLGPVLPAGLRLTIPAAPPAPVVRPVRLWGST